MEIVKQVFIPYCVYMASIVSLTTNYSLHFLDQIEDQNYDSFYQFSKMLIIILSTLSFLLWAKFVITEVNQIKYLSDMDISIQEHLSDFWNIIDFSSLLVNVWFLFILNVCVFSNSMVFSKTHVREVASIGSFILWIKVFYWMRLFKATAPFL